jgi:hypothetical protein
MINKDMTIEELVEKYPQTIGPLKEMGVNCVVCGEPIWGTIEDNVISKGLTDQDGIVSKLNNVINKSGEKIES